MPEAPRPPDECARLGELRAYDILDTPPEPSFDRLNRLASQILGTPIALITLIDEERQWFKASIGFDLAQTSRAVSFCAHTVAERSMIVVPDATRDPRFNDNPFVVGASGVRFYAGAPLTTPAGFVLGTICGVDTQPHHDGLTDLQRQQLTDLAALVVDELELRRSVHLLADQQRQLEVVTLATDAANDAIVITDAVPIDGPDGPRIVYANQAFLTMTGYDRAEVIGNTPRMLQGPDTDREALDRIREAIRAGRPCREELLNYRKDGSTYWVDLQITPVVGSNSRAPQLIAIQRDTTDRRARDEQLRQREEQLRQAEKLEAIGALAGAIAHDFNNLLTVMNGYTDLILGRATGDTPLREDLGQVRKAGDRAATLTQQLLAFSRRQVLQPQVVDARTLLETLRPMLSDVLRPETTLSIIVPDGLPRIAVDPEQFTLVLLNLATNAAEAMPAGGALAIECSEATLGGAEAISADVQPGRYLLIAVSDSGVGMGPETLARVFEPFFTTRRKGRSSGLGLPTAYGIVKQSGGHLEASSEPGHGATFRVYLPLATNVTTALRVATRAPRAETRGTRTILLVEDDEGVRRFATALLKGEGYDVLVADDGPAALELASDCGGRIDVLLTDVVMPKMSGRQVADELRARHGISRVVFMSGYAEHAIVSQGVLQAGLQFLPKPFTPVSLLAKVREALDVEEATLAIVVADDDGPLRRLLAMTLARAGYDVLEASDGRRALELCRQHCVALLLTDLVMPEQEGLETIRELRAELPDVQIIAMSGAFDGRFLDVARRFGAGAALQKPFDARTVLDTVASLIGTP